MPIQPPPVWVSPNNGNGWKVQREGADRASAITETQQEAFDLGSQIARNARTEVYLQNRHGQIRERNSFGHDPRASRG